MEESTLTTSKTTLADNSDSSAGNAPIAFEYYCSEIEADAPWFNYHEPRIVILEKELLVTICTTDKIGTIQSWRLFWVLFDSGSNVSIIKRSALPKGIITKLLGDTKHVRTLVECLKIQEVIMMWDLRLLKFDKNRRINQQKVFVIDSDNINTT